MNDIEWQIPTPVMLVIFNTLLDIAEERNDLAGFRQSAMGLDALRILLQGENPA